MIHISQENYIRRLLKKFDLEEAKTRMVPVDPFTHLTKEVECDSSEIKKFPFREAVGSLMFAVSCIRPDIAFSVGNVAQFCTNPAGVHWEAVKRILVYLKGTLSYGITFGGAASKLVLKGNSDADFASNIDDRRSTTGVVLLLNGGAVSWKSKKQKTVSLSTTESEYVAAATAAKEVVWVRRLLYAILNVISPDRQSCIVTTKVL